MLVYNRRGATTGKVIAEALGIPTLNPELETPEFLIRWGNSRDEWMDEEIGCVINKAEAIKNATDKLKSLELMENAGLNVPAFSTNPEELVEEYGYPILGRRLRHARGSDIQFCLQKRDFRRRRDFYTVYIPTNREFRVHVVRDKVVRVQGKYLDFPEKKKAWIRNFESGYRFRNPRLRLRPARLQDAITAVSALGLDFGAVDLIVGDDNETYILEVNTAPSCSPLTGAAYVTSFAEILHDWGVEVNLDALQLLNNEMEDEDTGDYDDDDIEEYQEQEVA